MRMIRGRAFLTTDNNYLFTSRDFTKVLASAAGHRDSALKLLSDKYYLWLLNFDHSGPLHDLWTPKDEAEIVGYLLLEGIWRLRVKNCASVPYAVLYFREEADLNVIVNNGSFTKQDLVDGRVTLRWLSPENVFWLDRQLERDLNAYTLKWEWIDKVARDTWNSHVPEKRSVFSDISEVVHVSNWNFMGLLTEWSRRQRLWNSAHAQLLITPNHNKDDTERHLRLCEYVYMFFHISVRWRTDRTEVAPIVTIGLSGIVLPTDPFNDELCVSQEDERWFNRTDNVNERHATVLARIGWERRRVEQCTQMLLILFANVRQNAEFVAQKVCMPVERARQKYASFQLFLSEHVNRIMQNNTIDIPPSMFDTEAVQEWATKRGAEIEETFRPRKLLASVYESLKACTREGCVLRLYGNMNRLLSEINGIGANSEYLYYAVNIGKLSAAPFVPQRLVGATTDESPPFEMPHTKIGTSETVKRLEEASAFCTPIWFVWEPNQCVPNFMTTRAVEIGKDRVPANLPMEPMNMLTFLDPERGCVYRPNGYAYEYINSKMHLSTIVVDCDLKLLDPSQPIQSIEHMARDMVELVEIVLERIRDVGGNKSRHFVFYSNPTNDCKLPTKYGLHHHIQLPPGRVFTVAAAAELMKILNVVRFIFPNTIGRACGAVNDMNVYDPCIYTGSENVVRGHGIRGPDQCKSNGTKKLICVYRTDGLSLQAPIPIGALYAHAPQLDANGQTVVVGTVIDRLNGALSLDDVEFSKQYKNRVVNRYTELRCGRSIQKILHELNYRTLLFDETIHDFPTHNDRQLLLECINSLWDHNGRAMLMKHMETALGNENCKYPTRFMTSVMPTSRFVLYKDAIRLVPALNDTNAMMPYCPTRPHRRKPSGVIVEVVFNRGMVVFGLRISCRKASCEKERFHKDAFIFTQKDFLAAPIHCSFVSEFLPLFDDTKAVDVIHPRVLKSSDDQFVNHLLPKRTDNTAPYSDYFNGTNDIMYLYAFENRTINAAILRSKNNHFVAMLTQGRRTIVATKSCSNLICYLREDGRVSADVLRQIGDIMIRDGQSLED